MLITPKFISPAYTLLLQLLLDISHVLKLKPLIFFPKHLYPQFLMSVIGKPVLLVAQARRFGGPLKFSSTYPIFHLSENHVGSAFRIYVKSHHLLWQPLWYEWSSHLIFLLSTCFPPSHSAYQPKWSF